MASRLGVGMLLKYLGGGLSLANACEAGIDYVARGLQQGYAPGRSEVLVLDHFGAAPHA